jgi:hypothetical protein
MNKCSDVAGTRQSLTLYSEKKYKGLKFKASQIFETADTGRAVSLAS